MLILTALTSIWLLLMFRSGIAEYKYYRSVRILEPEIWEQLGSPKHLKIPMVFVSPKGSKLLRGITNKTVREFAKKHKKAGTQFVSYVVLVLASGIVYFKVA